MTVFTIDHTSGKRVWYCPSYPVKLLGGSPYRGPRGDVYDRVKQSIWDVGVKYPIAAGTNATDIIPRTGKQRVQICKELYISHVPIVVWDHGNILPDLQGEWEEILYQEQGQALFSNNYHFTMGGQGIVKDLEPEYS